MPDRPFPIDFATLDTGPKPNTFLVLPEGFEAAAEPDLKSPVFEVEPARLLEAFKETALAAPRTAVVREGDGQIELVQRSAVFRFPDYITAQAAPAEGGSALCIFSRSKIGYSDLGVNAKRIKAWLEALSARL
jgi:uncharacterized protein (DUF1499 family)